MGRRHVSLLSCGGPWVFRPFEGQRVDCGGIARWAHQLSSCGWSLAAVRVGRSSSLQNLRRFSPAAELPRRRGTAASLRNPANGGQSDNQCHGAVRQSAWMPL